MTKKEKTRLLVFTKKLCDRPTMFVAGPPNFHNIIHFFDGYLFATEEYLKTGIIISFSSWVAVKFKAKFRNFSYSAYIMERYKSEKMRFKKLYQLFEEFLNTTTV